MKLISAELILPITRPLIKSGAVLIKDKRIAKIGPRKELKKGYPSAQEFHYPLLMPSLINAHTHLELSGIGLINQKDFVSWLIEIIQKKRELDRLKIEQSAKQEIEKSLNLGILSLGDIISEPIMFQVHNQSPLFSTLFLELIGMRERELSAKLEMAKTILGEFNYQLGNNRLGLSPHSAYTAHKELYRLAKILAKKQKLALCTHLAESEQESELVRTGAGEIFNSLYPLVNWQDIKPEPSWRSPAQYLKEFIDEELSLVHCVEVSDEDIEILCKAKAVVHCPRSNLNLLGKLAPLPKMLKAGIPVALGTDSIASAGDLNLWEEMKRVLELRNQYPGGEIKPFEILKMATINSARAIFRENELGGIEQGKIANLIAINLSHLPEQIEELSEAIIETGEKALGAIFIAGEKDSTSSGN